MDFVRWASKALDDVDQQFESKNENETSKNSKNNWNSPNYPQKHEKSIPSPSVSNPITFHSLPSISHLPPHSQSPTQVNNRNHHHHHHGNVFVSPAGSDDQHHQHTENNQQTENVNMNISNRKDQSVSSLSSLSSLPPSLSLSPSPSPSSSSFPSSDSDSDSDSLSDVESLRRVWHSTRDDLSSLRRIFIENESISQQKILYLEEFYEEKISKLEEKYAEEISFLKRNMTESQREMENAIVLKGNSAAEIQKENVFLKEKLTESESEMRSLRLVIIKMEQKLHEKDENFIRIMEKQKEQIITKNQQIEEGKEGEGETSSHTLSHTESSSSTTSSSASLSHSPSSLSSSLSHQLDVCRAECLFITSQLHVFSSQFEEEKSAFLRAKKDLENQISSLQKSNSHLILENKNEISQRQKSEIALRELENTFIQWKQMRESEKQKENSVDLERKLSSLQAILQGKTAQIHLIIKEKAKILIENEKLKLENEEIKYKTHKETGMGRNTNEISVNENDSDRDNEERREGGVSYDEENGIPLPLPSSSLRHRVSFPFRLGLRVPRSVHRGVSLLDSFMIFFLSTVKFSKRIRMGFFVYFFTLHLWLIAILITWQQHMESNNVNNSQSNQNGQVKNNFDIKMKGM